MLKPIDIIKYSIAHKYYNFQSCFWVVWNYCKVDRSLELVIFLFNSSILKKYSLSNIGQTVDTE